MTKSITEQIEDLQTENEHLRAFEKLFEKALKIEFGLSKKAIRKRIENPDQNTSDFEGKICSYFGLASDSDKDLFLSIICTDSSLNYFRSRANRRSTCD